MSGETEVVERQGCPYPGRCLVEGPHLVGACVRDGLLEWTETWDDQDNSIWEAPSAFVDGPDGSPFTWRLKQRLSDNRIEWFDDSDEELVGDGEDFWLNLAEAKASCQAGNDAILAECGEDAAP